MSRKYTHTYIYNVKKKYAHFALPLIGDTTAPTMSNIIHVGSAYLLANKQKHFNNGPEMLTTQ